MRKIFVIYIVWHLIASYMLMSDFVTYFPYDELKHQWVATKYVQVFFYLNMAYLCFAPDLDFLKKDKTYRYDYYWWKLCKLCLLMRVIFTLFAIAGYVYYGEFLALTIFSIGAFALIWRKTDKLSNIYYQN